MLRCTASRLLSRNVSRTSVPWRSTFRAFTSGPASSLSDLQITDRCVEMIQKLKQKDWIKNKDHAKLRVIVEGGGCSGFQYNFSVDDEPGLAEDDVVFEKEGAQVVIDQESLRHLKGSTIDYKDELIRSSFVVAENPNSEKNCGCGSSFASKVS
eukprot:TRINITY_DN18982_c0_g1_i1.p1 TRINITY_DN18982_c0_g1~~TRINITY_DN18982_c0_g1_i1.p1  ORF type:complete len:161 (+),score=9.50 TRINITY_DN18982_c0_g1_i1:23-484(+)